MQGAQSPRTTIEAGATPVAMMSYRLWRQKYGLDPSVIGGAFTLNGQPVLIAGIAPPSFYGDTLRETPPDFFMPLAIEPLIQGDNSILRVSDAHWLGLIGRIQPGASPASPRPARQRRPAGRYRRWPAPR